MLYVAIHCCGLVAMTMTEKFDKEINSTEYLISLSS